MTVLKLPGAPVPVVVLGSYVTVLGTIRCLGRVGIRSVCATPVDTVISCSRYYHAPSPEAGLLSDPAQLEPYLRALPYDRAVLMPCADDWVLAVASLPADLSERYLSSLSPLALLSALLDKGGLRDLLARFEIPRPRTIPLKSREDLREADWSSGGEWFLKPADSQAFRRRFGVKALRVNSEAEARQMLEGIHAAGLDCVLQEYVPGGADQHYFVDGFIDRQGEVSALFARRRLRIHPPDFGDSSSMVSVGLEAVEGAVASCRRLLKGVGYRGIFSAEFKRDPRDRQFKLIEVNTRPWAYVQFTASCGVNTPLMAYLDALGRMPPRIDSYPVGRRFFFWPADLFAAWNQWRRGQLRLFEGVRSWWGAEQAIFTWNDPLPAGAQLLSLVKPALRRLLGRAKSNG